MFFVKSLEHLDGIVNGVFYAMDDIDDELRLSFKVLQRVDDNYQVELHYIHSEIHQDEPECNIPLYTCQTLNVIKGDKIWKVVNDLLTEFETIRFHNIKIINK